VKHQKYLVYTKIIFGSMIISNGEKNKKYYYNIGNETTTKIMLVLT